MGRRRPQLARKNGLLGLGSCPGSKHGDRGQHYSKQIPTLTAADEDRAGSHEGLVLIKTSFVQLNSTSLSCLVLSAACSFHYCCCCQLGSKPVFTHECLSKIGLVTLK